jgi:acyl-CoA thioesterase-1
MMSNRPAFILAALLLLGGCHPNNTSSAPKDAPGSQRTSAQDSAPFEDQPAATRGPVARPQPAPNPDNRPLLVCFGDSLTAGYGTNPGQSYPDFLQADLDEAGFHYRVVNQGVSGATSKDGVLRLADVLALHPSVVIVEFGGNDGLRGLPVPAMRANLDRIVAALQAAGSKVMLAGMILPPDYGPDYVNSFVATYPALAARYRVPLYPFLLQDVYGSPGLMQADNIHATARGNELVARNLLPTVMPLLAKARQP